MPTNEGATEMDLNPALLKKRSYDYRNLRRGDRVEYVDRDGSPVHGQVTSNPTNAGFRGIEISVRVDGETATRHGISAGRVTAWHRPGVTSDLTSRTTRLY